jgi:hypothetical protein
MNLFYQCCCLSRKIDSETIEHLQCSLLGSLQPLSTQAKPIRLQGVPQLFYRILVHSHHIALKVEYLLQRLYIIKGRSRSFSRKNGLASRLDSRHRPFDIIHFIELLFIFSLSVNYHSFSSFFYLVH